MEPGGTSTAVTPKQTDVVDLEVEDSDSVSSLEIVEPAHYVAELFSPPRLTRYAPSAGLQLERPLIWWTGLIWPKFTAEPLCGHI